MEHWGDAHHPAWLDFVRIALGLLLLGRGVSFISDTDYLSSLIGSMKGLNMWTMAAVHYVAFAHLVGGFMIALGIMTRFASAVQIPILFVAVFFINVSQGFSYFNSELWLSIVTLALLIVYVIVGSGKFSADEHMKHQERKKR